MNSILRILLVVCTACLAACGSAGSDTTAVEKVTSFLNAEKNAGYGDQTVVAGMNNVRIGSITFSATTEGKKINSIDISLSSIAASSVANLVLKDNATGSLLSAVIAVPSAGNGFGVNFTVPASSSKTVDLYGNVLLGASVGTVIQATVTTSTSATGEITGTQSLVENPIPLQKIAIGDSTLVVNPSSGDPTSTNVIAGNASVKVGQFNFAGANSSYTVQNLAILVPNNAATSVNSLTVSYKDVNGAVQTQTQALAVNTAMPYATATFTGLTMYVPTNDSANVDVYASTATIASGATSGSAINVTLDTGATPGAFRAIDAAGKVVTEINAGMNVASNGTFYVRKSVPTFAMLPTGTTTPTTGAPLYRFSVTADPAGAIDWSKVTFDMTLSGVSVANPYLVDEASGVRLMDGYATVSPAGMVFDLSSNTAQPMYQRVAAGMTKTYAFYGTVSGFTTGSLLAINLVTDASSVANAPAASVQGNIVWSDRSGVAHSLITSDWTNGFLLKDLSGTTVYNK